MLRGFSPQNTGERAGSPQTQAGGLLAVLRYPCCPSKLVVIPIPSTMANLRERPPSLCSSPSPSAFPHFPQAPLTPGAPLSLTPAPVPRTSPCPPEKHHQALTCCTVETESTASPAASPACRPAGACGTREGRSPLPGRAEEGWRQREACGGCACR